MEEVAHYVEGILGYIYDRVLVVLVGINSVLIYIGTDNIKSFILFSLTVLLLLNRIRSANNTRKQKDEEARVSLEIKKEELRLAKMKTFEQEKDSFFKKFNDEFLIKKDENSE